jgi:hypothetical protein
MHATGMLFLNRTKPIANTLPDGRFQLMLFALDRIAPHQVEPWVLIWVGNAAQAFWLEHRAALLPGTALQVHSQRVRSFVVRGCAPEIHAHVQSLQLAPARADAAAATALS